MVNLWLTEKADSKLILLQLCAKNMWVQLCHQNATCAFQVKKKSQVILEWHLKQKASATDCPCVNIYRFVSSGLSLVFLLWKGSGPTFLVAKLASEVFTCAGTQLLPRSDSWQVPSFALVKASFSSCSQRVRFVRPARPAAAPSRAISPQGRRQGDVRHVKHKQMQTALPDSGSGWKGSDLRLDSPLYLRGSELGRVEIWGSEGPGFKKN